MTNNDTSAVKRSDSTDIDFEAIALDVYHDAFLIGVDAEGIRHYWSSYHSAAVRVLESGRAQSVETPTTAPDGSDINHLGDYVQFFEGKRGWETGPRYSESVADTLVEIMD